MKKVRRGRRRNTTAPWQWHCLEWVCWEIGIPRSCNNIIPLPGRLQCTPSRLVKLTVQLQFLLQPCQLSSLAILQDLVTRHAWLSSASGTLQGIYSSSFETEFMRNAFQKISTRRTVRVGWNSETLNANDTRVHSAKRNKLDQAQSDVDSVFSQQITEEKSFTVALEIHLIGTHPEITKAYFC